MAKRIGPEAKIIALFTALSEDSKRIVLDVIKSQSPKKASIPKSSAPSAVRKSSRKSEGAEPTANIKTAKVGAGDAITLPENPEDFHLGATA